MPTEPLDATDQNILDRLQEDARLTNVELARAVNLSPSPCLARVRRLEESGLIRRYVTLLDPVKLGLTVSVLAPKSGIRLPAGSDVLYREPTFWQQYRWYVALAIAFAGAQGGLIV